MEHGSLQQWKAYVILQEQKQNNKRNEKKDVDDRDIAGLPPSPKAPIPHCVFGSAAKI